MDTELEAINEPVDPHNAETIIIDNIKAVDVALNNFVNELEASPVASQSVYAKFVTAVESIKDYEGFRHFIKNLIVGQGTYSQATTFNRLIKCIDDDDMLKTRCAFTANKPFRYGVLGTRHKQELMAVVKEKMESSPLQFKELVMSLKPTALKTKRSASWVPLLQMLVLRDTAMLL